MLPIPLDSEGIRLDVLERTLATSSPAFVYVVPTYQNPTGSVLPDDSRAALARLAERGRTLIVEDLTPTLGWGHGLPAPIATFADPGQVITIGSLSKGGWGGLRIGWIRADRRLVMRLAAAKVVDDHGSSILSQAVAIRVLADVALHAERAERESRLRREIALTEIRRQLPDWVVAQPRGGLALWARLPGGDGEAFARVAAGLGVVVRPGPMASPHGGFRDHVRIAVGEHPDRLAEGIRRLAVAWSDYTLGRRPSIGSVAISV
jgi:DNA-binding transcriptional MocR family regulator